MRGARAGGRRRTPSRSPHLVDRNPSAGRPRPRGRSHFRVAEERGRRGEETSFPPSFVRSRGEEDDAQRLGFPQRGCPQCRSSPVFHVPIRQSQPDNFRSHNYRNVSRHLDNRRQQGSRAHSLPENSSRNSSRNDNISRDSRFRDNRRLRESRSHLPPPVRPRTTLLPPTRSTPMTKKLKQSPLPRTRTPPPQLLKLLPPMPPSQEQSLLGTYLGSETLPPDHKGVGAKDSDVWTYVQVVKQRPTRHCSQTYTTGLLSAQRLVGPIRPVDPTVERRCLRCLGRGHNIRECRDPVTCRLCLQPSYCQAYCPSRKLQSFNLARFGLFDCLVGEVRGWEPSLEYILEGLRTIIIERPRIDQKRMVWVYLLSHKSEAVSVIINFVKMIETQLTCLIKRFHSDNAKDYTNTTLTQFFNARGIIHETSCVNTPQQNGIAERKNRHLLEVTRALLFQHRVPPYFWGDALLTSAHLINFWPSTVLDHQSPSNFLRTFYPNHSWASTLPLRVFGCVAYIHLPSKAKLAPRALKCMFLGYSSTQKGYRCYDPTHKRYYVTKDVRFDELKSYYDVTSTLVDLLPPFPEESSQPSSSPSPVPHLAETSLNSPPPSSSLPPSIPLSPPASPVGGGIPSNWGGVSTG